MTERKPPGISWESFVERQIREAQQAGEFDHLPGFGEPLAGLDEPYDELWWLKKKIRRENLSLTPPGLRIRADVERTLRTAMELEQESQVRQILEALNQRIREANRTAVWGPPSTTMPLEIERMVDQWRTHRQRTAGNVELPARRDELDQDRR